MVKVDGKMDEALYSGIPEERLLKAAKETVAEVLYSGWKTIIHLQELQFFVSQTKCEQIPRFLSKIF